MRRSNWRTVNQIHNRCIRFIQFTISFSFFSKYYQMHILFIFTNTARVRISGVHQSIGRRRKKSKKNVTFSFCDSNRFRIFFTTFFYINIIFLSVILKLFTRATTYWKFILCFFFKKKICSEKLFLCICV